MEKRTSLIILAVCLALLVACAVTLVVHHFVTADDGPSSAIRYGEEIRPLVIRREEIYREISELRSDPRYTELPFGSNATVMYVDLDAQLFDFVYSVAYANTAETYGTVCFSPSEMPGVEGNISVAQCNELIGVGWSVAIFWDGTRDLGEYLPFMGGLLFELGYEMPDTVFFAKGVYRADLIDVLAEHGIRYAVHHGEESDSLVEIRTDAAVLLPGAVGWNAPNQQKNFLKAIEQNHGCGVYSVSFGFGNDADAVLRLGDQSARDAFCRMIDYLDSYAVSGTVGSLGLADAFATRTEYEAEIAEIDREVEERIAVLSAELDEIERQMLEISKKYEEK